VRITHHEYWDAQGLRRLLQARDLMPAWRETIEAKLERALAASGWQGLREFEVVRRDMECADTVSLYLKCIRDRPLAPFRGGQRLTVVLGGRSAHQHRRAYAISSSPREFSTYRITVRRMAAPEASLPDGIVSSRLVAMEIGERLLCTAPHGSPLHDPETCGGRVPVLLSQGLGIAPLLSLLYELEAEPAAAAWLFHESGDHEPQGLLREARALADRNTGFHMIEAAPETAERAGAELIRRGVPLDRADFRIAGSTDFVERWLDQLRIAGAGPSILVVQRFG
jgi:ferredoxin-NADP reductase